MATTEINLRTPLGKLRVTLEGVSEASVPRTRIEYYPRPLVATGGVPFGCLAGLSVALRDEARFIEELGYNIEGAAKCLGYVAEGPPEPTVTCGGEKVQL